MYVFIYRVLYKQQSYKYAVLSKIVYIRMSNTGDQHPN